MWKERCYNQELGPAQLLFSQHQAPVLCTAWKHLQQSFLGSWQPPSAIDPVCPYRRLQEHSQTSCSLLESILSSCSLLAGNWSWKDRMLGREFPFPTSLHGIERGNYKSIPNSQLSLIPFLCYFSYGRFCWIWEWWKQRKYREPRWEMERWRVYKDKTSVKLRSICKESEYLFSHRHRPEESRKDPPSKIFEIKKKKEKNHPNKKIKM